MVKSITKPVLEVVERESVPRSTTVNLKVTFNVIFENPSTEILEGRDLLHAKYGIRVEVSGYENPSEQRPGDHTHLFYFERMVLRWVPGGGILTGGPLGGSFQTVPTKDYLLPGGDIMRTEPIDDIPYIKPDDFNSELTYGNQTVISQEVSFDQLDVNKKGNVLTGDSPEEKDIIYVRLFIIDLETGHVAKEARSNNFEGFFEIGTYEASSKDPWNPNDAFI